jgi:hypothetical protein
MDRNINIFTPFSGLHLKNEISLTPSLDFVCEKLIHGPLVFLLKGN